MKVNWLGWLSALRYSPDTYTYASESLRQLIYFYELRNLTYRRLPFSLVEKRVKELNIQPSSFSILAVRAQERFFSLTAKALGTVLARAILQQLHYKWKRQSVYSE